MLSMLAMQVAVASYACPGMPSGNDYGAASVHAATMDMADCQGVAETQPPLCHLLAHGALPKQTFDKTATPAVPPFVPATLMLDLRLVNAIVIADATPFLRNPLTRTTAPPVAIRNCCLRI